MENITNKVLNSIYSINKLVNQKFSIITYFKTHNFCYNNNKNNNAKGTY